MRVPGEFFNTKKSRKKKSRKKIEKKSANRSFSHPFCRFPPPKTRFSCQKSTLFLSKTHYLSPKRPPTNALAADPILVHFAVQQARIDFVFGIGIVRGRENNRQKEEKGAEKRKASVLFFMGFQWGLKCVNMWVKVEGKVSFEKKRKIELFIANIAQKSPFCSFSFFAPVNFRPRLFGIRFRECAAH
jgi:hypothetical protein